MFRIRDQQIEAFQKIEQDKFIQKSVLFLQQNFPDWCKGKEKAELEIFVNDIITFGRTYAILKQLNLQKLMYFKIQFDFDIPLVPHLNEYLKPINVNENYRIKCFYKSLFNNELPVNVIESEEIDWWA